MALEGLAKDILSYVNYGITIVVILLLIEVGRLAGRLLGMGTETKVGKRLLDFKKSPVLNLLKGEDKKAKRARKAAAREKTALLNEYVEERKELELIEKAQTELGNFVVKLTGGEKIAEVEKLFGKFKKAVEKADKEVSRLERKTFRQERRYHQLIQELEDAGIRPNDLSAVKVYEKDLLVQHDNVVKAIEEVKKVLGKIGNQLKKKNATKLLSAGGAAAVQTETDVVDKGLKDAKKAQEQAYKETESIIAAFQKFWKP